MLNNCYTLRHSPVFRNPKSNQAVQQLTTLINDTAGRLSPLQPQVKKIIGIKKNSSTDRQLPLCEVPFQTNFFAQHENDIAYSNRSNIQTNRQFSRNQRTQSVYTGNKENFVRSPTRSPFSKPVIQKDCFTPIYNRSPIQRVQSPGIIVGIRQTNQKGFGSISPMRIQQRVNIREPLSEMVDNLKQNILRDIQEVTKKYSNTILQANQQPEKIIQEQRETRFDEFKVQEFKKQQYLEHQLELIKSQQQKLVVQNKQSFCSQENLMNATLDQKKHFQQRQHDLNFLKSLEYQIRSQSFVDQQSNFQSLKQETQKIKQIQEIKKFTYDPQYQLQFAQQQIEERTPLQNISKYNQQIDYLQRLNNKIESISKQQHHLPEYQNPQGQKKNDEFSMTKLYQDQQLKNTIDMNQEKQCVNYFQSPFNLNQEKQYPVFNTARSGYSPIGREVHITNKESANNTLNNTKQILSTLNSQNELQKLKNLQLELKQNKPVFEQTKQQKMELDIKKFQETGETKIDKTYFNPYSQTQQIQIEKSCRQEKIQEINQENSNLNKAKQFNVFNSQQSQQQQKLLLQQQVSEQSQLQNQYSKKQQKFPAYLKGPNDTDDDVNNQITISNLSSIIPAEISANQHKKINVSFESSIEQQQLDYLKGSDCRNTFGPLQLETILKSPKENCEILQEKDSPCQPEFDLNSSRYEIQNHNKNQEIPSNNEQEIIKSSRKFTKNQESEKEQSIKKSDEQTGEIQFFEQIEMMEKIVRQQSQAQSQCSQSRDSKSLENQSKQNNIQNSGSNFKNKSSQNKSSVKQSQAYSPMETKISIVVQPFQKESSGRKSSPKEIENNNVQIQSQQSILINKNCDKISSGKGQRYSDYKEEVKQLDDDKQEQDYLLNNSTRYEQMNQSLSEFQLESQTFKQSMQVNECEHISDFVIFSDKQNENQLEIIKKKNVTFNQQLIQQSLSKIENLQTETNFSDFMKIKALDILSSDSIPVISQDAFTLTQLQPKGGISFLQYKQQLETE
ncbi:unnamed protein product (macronuclear) [Paramecium tetraurelia]|uniref:Endo-1,4-beta-xylanase xylA n=1 Tax=Paramecium tetraurelia TaxID=5888 RepID=A0EDI6_PARTE|nr:uncharacterized protein GSPATT00004222001 [Paramecium tetraurelia]CAK93353.1 unnamed protein product [Paramecium tetraurelia]|eukprot:XP_001460750.1 hypothetical protein (macronuclear) [Paramecium tetraurelia strain d4-2]